MSKRLRAKIREISARLPPGTPEQKARWQRWHEASEFRLNGMFDYTKLLEQKRQIMQFISSLDENDLSETDRIYFLEVLHQIAVQLRDIEESHPFLKRKEIKNITAKN